jgi:hypothetical protein
MRNVAFAALVGSCALAATASADIILSNLPGNPSGTGTNLGLGTDGVDRTKGVGLTMGVDSMQFVSMEALMNNSENVARDLSGGIYADAGGNPGALLAGFVPVSIPAGTDSQVFSISTAGAFTLDAGTTYWFVLDGPGTTNSLLWESLNPNQAPTGTVAFVGYRFSSNGGASWGSSSIYNGMTINAVIPAPGTLGVLALAGLASRRRR